MPSPGMVEVSQSWSHDLIFLSQWHGCSPLFARRRCAWIPQSASRVLILSDAMVEVGFVHLFLGVSGVLAEDWVPLNRA